MYKRIVSLMTILVMIAMGTKADFVFPVKQMATRIIGQPWVSFANQEGTTAEALAMNLKFDINVSHQCTKQDPLMLDLYITGFENEKVYFGEEDVTERYKEITEEKFPDRILQFDCRENIEDHKYVFGVLKEKDDQNELKTVIYYDNVPPEIPNSCKAIESEVLKPKTGQDDGRLLMI